jgi:hypothetical protein
MGRIGEDPNIAPERVAVARAISDGDVVVATIGELLPEAFTCETMENEPGRENLRRSWEIRAG